MTEPLPTFHGNFTIERNYPAAPKKVFAAFANEASKRRWFAEVEGFETFEYKLDFRVGGAELSRFRFGQGPEVWLRATYHDIVADRRIILTYAMGIGEAPFSVSLTTTLFEANGTGTRMTFTEQGAYLDKAEAVKGREVGTRDLFERLAGELERA